MIPAGRHTYLPHSYRQPCAPGVTEPGEQPPRHAGGAGAASRGTSPTRCYGPLRGPGEHLEVAGGKLGDRALRVVDIKPDEVRVNRGVQRDYLVVEFRRDRARR